jgi:MFS family permease
MKISSEKQGFFLVNLGVAFEHLDMMISCLLASCIVKEFIYYNSYTTKLLVAYTAYAIAFLFRPLGAFFFGCIADLYGRKISLLGSMVLMSTATFAIAFIPSVKVLGFFSTILFLICRIAQGLAVGGEYGTAMTYSYELNPKLRTFYGACVICSTHIGGLFASFLASKYVENFRLTFLIGGLMGFFILLFRSILKQCDVSTSKKLYKHIKESVKNKKAILKVVIVASMQVLVFYGSLIYVNELVYQNLCISRSLIFKANCLLLGLWVILPFCFGYAIDRFDFPYLKIMRFSALGVFFSAPILGFALTSNSYKAILCAQIFMHIFHMGFCLCTPHFFGDLFHQKIRATAISTSYSLGASFSAAFAPLICHLSIDFFHTTFAICAPFMTVALVAIFILKQEYLCKKMTLLNSTT